MKLEAKVLTSEERVNREQDAESELFTTRALCALEVSLDEYGNFIDPETGEDAEAIARLFSRMKHGDPDAIELFAYRLTHEAVQNPDFLSFLWHQPHNPNLAGDVVITSPGMGNIPTASRRLLTEVTYRVNNYITIQDFSLPPLMMDGLIPVESDGVSENEQQLLISTAHKGRMNDARGFPVVFVDDLYVSLEATKYYRQQLLNAGASDVFFLYALRLTGKHPTMSREAIETLLNRRSMRGSLEDLKPIVSHPRFTVVHRALVDVLSPQNRESLPVFLTEIPDQALLKLYNAASSADFRSQYNGLLIPSFEILRQTLRERGWIDEHGLLFLSKKLKVVERERTKPVHRIANFTLERKRAIPFAEAQRYSRMKYSDPVATREIAEQMLQTINAKVRGKLTKYYHDPLVITSSAYGSTPTAAAAITSHIARRLRDHDEHVEMIKIRRSGQMATSHFGRMTAIEREAELKKRKLEISSEDLAKLDGATVLVIDDLRATGSHERAIEELLEETNAKQIIFVYHIEFGERLLVDEPDTEEWLNRAAVKTVKDLLPSWMKDNAQLLGKPITKKLEYMIPYLLNQYVKKDVEVSWKIGSTLVRAEMIVHRLSDTEFMTGVKGRPNEIEIVVSDPDVFLAEKDRVRVYVKGEFIGEKQWDYYEVGEVEKNPELRVKIEVNVDKSKRNYRFEDFSLEYISSQRENK